jgi:hypothetical protein
MGYGGSSYGVTPYGSKSGDDIVEVDISLKTAIAATTNLSLDESISRDGSQRIGTSSLTTTTNEISAAAEQSVLSVGQAASELSVDISTATEGAEIRASGTGISADLQNAADQTASVDESTPSASGTSAFGTAELSETVELPDVSNLAADSLVSSDSGITSDESLLSGAGSVVEQTASASIADDASTLTQTEPSNPFSITDDLVQTNSLDTSTLSGVIGSPNTSDELSSSVEIPLATSFETGSVNAAEIAISLDPSDITAVSAIAKRSDESTKSVDESTVSISDAQTIASVEISEAVTNVTLTALQTTVPFAATDATIFTETVEQAVETSSEALTQVSSDVSTSLDSPSPTETISIDKPAVSLSTGLDEPVRTEGGSLVSDAFLRIAASATRGGAQSSSRAGTTLSTSLDQSLLSGTTGETRVLADGQDNTAALDESVEQLVAASAGIGAELTRSFTDASVTISSGIAAVSDEQALTIEEPAQTASQSEVEGSVSEAIATDDAVLTDANTLSKLGVTTTLSAEEAVDAVSTADPRPGDEIASSITAASASTSGGTATLSQSTAFSIDEPANTASAGSSQGSNEVSSSLDTSVVSVSNAQTPVGLSASTATENVGITVESTGTSAFLSDANVATASTDGSVETGVGASVGDSITASSASAVGSRVATEGILQSSLDATTSVEGVEIRASAGVTSFETLNAEVLTVAIDGSTKSVAVTRAFDSVSVSTAFDEAGVVQLSATVAQTLEFTASQTDAALTRPIGASIRSEELSLTFDTGEKILSESEAFQAESFRVAFATGILSDAVTTAAIAAEQSLSVEEPVRSLFSASVFGSDEQSTATDISALTESLTALFNSDEKSSSVDSSVLSTSVSPALASLTSSLARENAILNADVSSFSTALQDADDSTASVTAASESGVDAPPFVSGEFSEAIEEPLQSDSATAVRQSDELASALDISDLTLTTPFSELGASLSQALAEGNVTVSSIAIFILTVDDVFFETSSTSESKSDAKENDSVTQAEVD